VRDRIRNPNHYEALKQQTDTRSPVEAATQHVEQEPPEPEQDRYQTRDERVDAARQAYAAKLANDVELGRLAPFEQSNKMAQWENETVRQIEAGEWDQPTPAPTTQDDRTDLSLSTEAQPRAETAAERQAKSAEHLGGIEMTDAQRARYERLMGGDFREVGHEITDHINHNNDGGGGRERGE
jgi:hypothetical protein